MMVPLLYALAPIAILIAIGFALRKRQVVADHFWAQAERLSYYVLLPALFIYGLSNASLEGLPIKAMVATLVISTVSVSAIMVFSRRWMNIDDAGFTSIFQGAVRFNNYVGVSAAAAMFGAKGIALAAIANAAIVPTVNVLCVLVFARYGNIGQLSIKNILKQLALNPLVVACAIGIMMQLIGFRLPDSPNQVLRSLGQASLPLGLLCVGAALELSSAKTWIGPTVIASTAKFVLMPVATVLACHVFSLTAEAATAALIFQALPTASSAYIMARQLGGDAPLMAGIVAVQTVMASILLPLAVILLGRLL